MKRAILILAVVVLVSGCTSMSGEASESEGVTVDASLTNSQIYSDGSTDLMIEVTNANSQPLEDVEVQLANTGKLNVEEKVSDCKGEIGAADMGVPVKKTCIWTLSASEDLDYQGSDPVTVPVTLLLDYNSILEHSESSIKLNFKEAEDFSAGEQQTSSISFSNGDIQMTAESESPVSAESGAFDIELSVSNTGPGSIRSISDNDDTRDVKVTYSGSFTMLGGDIVSGLNPDTTTCLDGEDSLKGYKTLNFLEESSTASFECQFGLTEDVRDSSNLADTEFTLRPSVEYNYMRDKDLPLTFVPQ